MRLKRAILPWLKGWNHMAVYCRTRGLRNLAQLDICPRTMILAPHMDDEVIGCGGMIRLRSLAGCRVACIYLTNGTPEGCRDREALYRTRVAETKAATAMLGVKRLYFLDRQDGGGLNPDDGLERELLEIFNREEPGQVFLPNPHDPHPDHHAVACLVSNIYGRLARRPRLFLYQIQAPLARDEVTAVLDITPVAEIKRRALAVYSSQSAVPFDVIWHLQCCQRYLAGRASQAAELYGEVTPGQLSRMARLQPSGAMQVKSFFEVGFYAARRKTWI